MTILTILLPQEEYILKYIPIGALMNVLVMDQIGSDRVRLDQIRQKGSVRIILVLIGTDWIKLDKIASDWIR